MSVAEPKPSPVERMRARAAADETLAALDPALLEALDVIGEGDLDAFNRFVAGDATLRNRLSSWLVSAEARGLVSRRKVGTRQRFALTGSGRDRVGSATG